MNNTGQQEKLKEVTQKGCAELRCSLMYQEIRLVDNDWITDLDNGHHDVVAHSESRRLEAAVMWAAQA